MTTPPPHLHNTSGSRFSQRLGYFLGGVAIGLILLGFFMSARQRAAQQAQADQATSQRTAQPGHGADRAPQP
tara:strand:+ start:2139 stop:2354 length:216 start_codon:yes stop_codon:yes gene_type:complete